MLIHVLLYLSCYRPRSKRVRRGHPQQHASVFIGIDCLEILFDLCLPYLHPDNPVPTYTIKKRLEAESNKEKRRDVSDILVQHTKRGQRRREGRWRAGEGENIRKKQVKLLRAVKGREPRSSTLAIKAFNEWTSGKRMVEGTTGCEGRG